jgi:hypothetical protein
MEGNAVWKARFSDALASKREDLEARGLPELNKQLGVFQSYFEGIYNILLKKALVQEDPYKYDHKITEISAPSDSEFTEMDKQNQMSQRLAAFQAQLEFLNTQYQFSTGFLDLRRIKKILSLIDYINWAHLSGNDSNPVSKALDELMAKINLGTDSLSSQIINESLSQLEGVTRKIKLILRDCADYQRESYKSEARQRLLPELDGGSFDAEKAMQSAKTIFAKNMQGTPFYPELIRELLNEEFAAESEPYREEALKRLAIRKPEPREKVEVSHKELLVKAVRALAASGFQMKDVIEKIENNHGALSKRKRGLFQALGAFLRRIFGGGEPDLVYEIKYFDVTTASDRRESILYDSFMEEIRKKAGLFRSLLNQESSASRKLMAAPEEKILDFVNRQVSSLQTLHRRLIGMNDYFKEAITKEKSGKFRGLRVELAAIKNSIIKCNQAKGEYVSAREQQVQMEKLGLKAESTGR